MFDKHGTEMAHQPYFVFPSFPGGIENLMKLVANVTKYPEDAWKQKAEGRVILQFVVDEEGKMTYPKILQSVRYDIDKEAIRAFEAIADVYRWSPGYQDGEAQASEIHNAPYTSEYPKVTKKLWQIFIPKFPN